MTPGKPGASSLAKRLGALALTASLVPLLQGCRAEEVALTLGIVAVGAAAVAIGSKDRGDDHHRHRRHHRPPRRYRHRISLTEASVQPLELDAKAFAETFKLSESASKALIEAFYQLEEGNSSVILALGLTEEDLRQMAQFRMISDSSVEQLAVKLGQDPQQTRSMFNTLIENSKEEARSLDSYMWQSCLEAGKWKTIANNGVCASTSWQGCSPANGATFCTPVVAEGWSI